MALFISILALPGNCQKGKMTKMTSRNAKSELKLAHAAARPQHSTEVITFKQLKADRYQFTVRPKYQRELTWNLREKQQYIDSLFSGDPVPPVEGYQVFFTEGPHIGEPQWEIGDGQNRLFTLLQFMEDGFRTMSEAQKLRYEPFSQTGPIAPGKLFSELDQITRNYFLNYKMRIDVLHDRKEAEKVTRFLRVENHIPLSAAERLKVSTSKARAAVARIEQHPFWDEFYDGKRARGEIFQSSLYLLALEMAPDGMVDLQSGGFTQSLIFGHYDDRITDALTESAIDRLDVVSHVYSGLHFTRRIITVAMYQSVIFLERAGYIVQARDKGTLVKWLDPILDETRRSSGIPSYAKPIQALASKKGQVAFWDKHWETVKALFGISETAEITEKAMAVIGQNAWDLSQLQ